MTKLNQIVALINGLDGKKTKVNRKLTEIHHKLQKAEPFQGLERTYQPSDENGETLPPETKRVQFTVKNLLDEAQEHLSELLDVVFVQDKSNCMATADIIVDDKVLIPSVPITYMMFLEKQLENLHNLVEKLPVLSATNEWVEHDSVKGIYRSDPQLKNRTKRVLRNHVKSEATERHPAQVEVYQEDVKIGEFKEVQFSGAISENRKATLLRKVEKLQDAVKLAREQANNAEVKHERIASHIFDFVFKE